MWKDLLHQNLRKGEYNYVVIRHPNSKEEGLSDIIAISFWDKKIVNFLTNCVGIGGCEIETPKGIKIKPKIVYDYNQRMNFVDIADSTMNRYNFRRLKAYRWTSAAFIGDFLICLNNSKVAWDNFKGKKKKLVKFFTKIFF